MSDYCRLCGWALALAHAKSGDPAVIAGYVGKTEVLDDTLASFSLAYADQTERDHELLVKAARTLRPSTAAEWSLIYQRFGNRREVWNTRKISMASPLTRYGTG